MGYTEMRKVLEFLLYTLLIYGCYLTSAIYHEKILKHAYTNDYDNTISRFDAAIIFTFFPNLCATFIGFIYKYAINFSGKDAVVQIPAKKAVACSAVININMLTYNKAIQGASFPAVVMVKSCSMLSVIMVALFCSRVKDVSLMLSRNKLWVGLIVSVGIFVFNYFKENKTEDNNQSISLVSGILLVVSLLGDGVLPDLQAEIKSEFKPGTMDMYYEINKYTAIISLAYATIAQQLVYISTFIWEHSQLQWDILYFSVLNSVGQLVIYRMIKLFKQHIPPFVIATRKCITVVVNIIYFKHSINTEQTVGIGLVFTAIMLEVVLNYREKKKQLEKVPSIDMKEEEEKDKGAYNEQERLVPMDQHLQDEIVKDKDSPQKLKQEMQQTQGYIEEQVQSQQLRKVISV